MRYLAIRIDERRLRLVQKIDQGRWPIEDFMNYWYMVPEDGSQPPFVINDYTLRCFEGADATRTIQTVER